MSHGGAFRSLRRGERPAVQLVHRAYSGVELEYALALLADDDADLLISDFNYVSLRLRHVVFTPAFASVLAVMLIVRWLLCLLPGPLAPHACFNNNSGRLRAWSRSSRRG